MTEIRMRSVMPVLRVSNLERALRFYQGLLGFRLAWRAGNDGGGENCMLESGDVALMLSTGSHLGGTPRLTGTLYFNMTRVRELYEALKDRAEIAWPPSEMEYGTLEFGIHDPDGYTLAFAEELED
jgi:catechol 2,3-dioxygenase-like lactoylglutathione lyase family enzyme